MEKNAANRTLALAALFQQVDGVYRLAHDGEIEGEIITAALRSLVVDDAPDLAALYGGISGLERGLRVLQGQLRQSPQSAAEAQQLSERTRYSVNLMYLERQLQSDQEVSAALFEGIAAMQKQHGNDIEDEEALISALADLYQSTLSNMQPKIIVKGNSEHLSRDVLAAKIRVLLMAGVRAALLWRQAGGSRWTLMLGRKSLLQYGANFLRQTD